MISHGLQIAVKVLFTGVLLLFIALCGVEIWRLWFDRTLVLVSFRYIRNGEPAPEAGQHFTRMLSQDLNYLQNLYSGRLSGGEAAIPSTDQLGRGEDIPLPELRESVFSSIEIEAYGVQLSTILKTLLRWIEKPNAIDGSVSESARGIDVHAELQRVSPNIATKVSNYPWYIFQMEDINEASFALACRVFRRQAASRSSLYTEVLDPEFYVFTRALMSYQFYRDRLAAAASEEEVKNSLSEASALVSKLSERNSRFPFVYKLAAYIHREGGNLNEAERTLRRYLALIKEHSETDRAAEELALALRGEVASTEVKVERTAEELGLREKRRPVQPGFSVSSLRSSAGTICCIVRDAGGQEYLLSADHVFQGDIGDPIIQPGAFDGGQSSDQIAKIVRKITSQPDKVNQVAAAIARLSQGVEAFSEIPGIGPIRGIATTVQPGDVLLTVGRSSGLVKGEVLASDISSRISIGIDYIAFEGLIQTTNMSSGGDSGAPVLTMDGKLVGMIYAGSSTTTLVMPIQPILQALNVDLVQ